MPVSKDHKKRDHGGGLDAAIARWGGRREDWIDLSTGINPVPFPVGDIPVHAWTGLPDTGAQETLLAAARNFWNVPVSAAILAAPGASALIARIPALATADKVDIPAPTYNEHEAAFVAQGWVISDHDIKARVLVHPNNPTGRLWTEDDLTASLTVIDESFCDVTPEASLIHVTEQPGRVVLKSFGKFWGLAGLRLGFAIGHPDTIAHLTDLTGPWAVSGPALHVGARALSNPGWALETRKRLSEDSLKLDRLMENHGVSPIGGTSLFRLYDTENATLWQERLAANRIWSRIFPYSSRYLRLGLPAPDQWERLEEAL